MERATVMKTFHGNLAPKSPTLRDRDASFSSYLQPQHHPTMTGSGRCRGLDDSTTELSIFDAHKYFNEEVTNNDNSIQKVTTISSSSNSRVSPLVNNTNSMGHMERIIPEKGGTTTVNTRHSSASSSVDGYANNIRNYRARSFHAATPTASSEASWNSQAGLLSHPPGAIPVSMRDPPNPNDLNKKLKASLSKPIWLFRRKCPCSGKKSVEVREKKTPEPKTQISALPTPQPQRDHHSSNLKRQDHETTVPKKPEILNNWVVNQRDCTFVSTTKSQRFHSHRVVTSSARVPFTEGFTFPVLKPHSSATTSTSTSTSTSISISSSTNTTKPGVPNGVVLEEQDPERDSLEVFQPPINDAVELPLPTSASSPQSRVNVIIDDDDRASDASSDLFDIESFSTATMYRRGDSIDEAASSINNNSSNSNSNGFFYGWRSMDEVTATPAITECYEPSEASIEWSVTTAEGCYDRASVAAEEESSAVNGHGDAAAEKWKRKGGNGLLVSCRCEKAVSVGPQPVKSEGQRGATCSSRHVSVSGSNSRAGSVNVNKPPLGRSHNNASRVSLAFTT